MVSRYMSVKVFQFQMLSRVKKKKLKANTKTSPIPFLAAKEKKTPFLYSPPRNK